MRYAVAVLLLVLGASPSRAQDSRDLREWLTQVMPSGSQIGVSLKDVQPDSAGAAREGAVVTAVTSGMAADKAGVKANDIVVEFDGERVRSASQLTRLIHETPAGRTVGMTVARAGKRIELKVTPAEGGGNFERPLPPPNQSPRAIPPFNNQPPLADGWRFWFPPNPPGPLRRGSRLGIQVQDLTPQLAVYFGTNDGVLVASVEDGSPASRACLKAGDIITSLDGREVRRREDVTQAVSEKRPGDRLTLGIVRDRKPRTIEVTLGEISRGM